MNLIWRQIYINLLKKNYTETNKKRITPNTKISYPICWE